MKKRFSEQLIALALRQAPFLPRVAQPSSWVLTEKMLTWTRKPCLKTFGKSSGGFPLLRSLRAGSGLIHGVAEPHPSQSPIR
jgi:hypothetical protein